LKGAATAAVDQVVSSTTTVSLPGTWSYNGCAIAATTDNMLTTLAANAGTASIETKVDEALAKVGIKAGVATFTFSEDGNFTFACGKVSLPGTWEVKESAVTLNFSKLINIKISGTVKATGTGCELMFDATKFLNLVQKIVTVLGKTSNSTIAALATSVSSISGLELGFKLSKK